MLGELLVAWSGSARSRAALRWAVERPGTTSIRLIRALGAGPVGADIEVGSRHLLDSEVDRIHEQRPELVVDRELVGDDVEPALLARSVAGILLVVGSGGPAARFLPHRTAMLARLARLSVGPIVFVPPQTDAPLGPVIAGVDDTAAGTVAAQVAAAEADSDTRSLIGLRVDPSRAFQVGWPGARLDRLALDVAAHHPHLLVRERMVRGDVADELLLAASGASLLVLGRHEQPGAGTATVHDALVHAAAPLMLVRETDALWPTASREVVDPALAG